MMTRQGERFRKMVAAVVTALAVTLAAAGPLAAAVRVETAAGITAAIHAGDDLAPFLHEHDGSLWLEHPRWGRVELLTGVDDPRLPRRDVTRFVPLPADGVAAALAAVHDLSVRIDVQVVLLPTPPAATLGSFARRDVIFLSPALGTPATAQDVAWVTTHELGHVLTWGYVDPRPELWDRYRRLRGLDAERNGPTASHAWREREILAEDIRVLFGGSLAAAVAIENHSLTDPRQVAGLADLLGDALRGPVVVARPAVARVFPNPCRPGATVEVGVDPAKGLDAAGPVRVDVFDLAGRHVRTLAVGTAVNGRLLVSWDGRDEAGRERAAGGYLLRVSWPGGSARGRLLLVR